MAVVTRDVNGGTAADNTTWVVQYDYDDATLTITKARCVNNTPDQKTVAATLTSNGRTYSMACDPHATTEVNVPTGAAVRLQLFVDGRGRLDGVDWSIS